MCMAVLGGMNRLRVYYREVALRHNVTVHHLLRYCPGMGKRLGGVDAIVVFTNMASHDIVRLARSKGREAGVPVFMCRACGTSSFEKFLSGLSKTEGGHLVDQGLERA